MLAVRVGQAGPGTAGESSVLRYFSGAVASMGAVIFSNPIEVVKTRMQLQVRPQIDEYMMRDIWFYVYSCIMSRDWRISSFFCCDNPVSKITR